MTASTPPAFELPDSRLARTVIARVWAEEAEPIANHSIRSFLFGRLASRAEGVPVDEELLFASCVLHDIGLTQNGNGSERFEIDGADYARRILAQIEVPEEALDRVWDAIALHTSPGLAERRSPLARFTRAGIGVDLGRNDGIVADSDVATVNDLYPRLSIETRLTHAVMEQARDNPAKAPRNSWADVLILESSMPPHLTRLEASVAGRTGQS